MPKQIPPQESLPFPEPVPAPDHPAPDQAMASARPRTPARDVRPWWARLLGRLLDPWIALDVVPAAPGSNFDGRPVCYVLEDYGLDLRGSVEGMQVVSVVEDGDRATVDVRYPLAGRTITTRVHLERIDRQWYSSDSIRNARASLAGTDGRGMDDPADPADPTDADEAR